MKRVVITGVGGVSPLGQDIPSLLAAIEAGRCGTRRMDGWDQYPGLRSHVAAPAELKDEKKIPRQSRRTMGRMSIFAVQAAEQALADAGLAVADVPAGRMGCIIGSTTGSAISLYETYKSLIPVWDITNLSATRFFQCVSHSAAMNVSQHLGITGRIMATCAACVSSLQAIGAGYDLIRLGEQDAVVCGGAEELHPTTTGSFDALFATSVRYNDEPSKTPRPFDRDRDGLVCGEGAGIVVLEDYDRAVARGAKIHAEIIGYHTNGSAEHVSQSSHETIAACMRGALESAGLGPDAIRYINAHATGTVQGDTEEAAAIRELFGDRVPVSSLKGYLGHLLGASGVLELIVSLAMMRAGVLYPTRNLDAVAADCEGVDHVMSARRGEIPVLLKNGFAFGGINAVLVCRKAPA
ncbi:MAG: beta-ketoacyl synthase [Verrucomicrobia bacterium A1]|nr:MAG: beta-ketoacyl synthase [Verrucomicrobia bacterium A1]